MTCNLYLSVAAPKNCLCSSILEIHYACDREGGVGGGGGGAGWERRAE